MGNSRSEWKEEETDKLKELWGTATVRSIAFTLKRTEPEISNKAKELGLSSNKGPADRGKTWLK